jgi:hypothetical protein
MTLHLPVLSSRIALAAVACGFLVAATLQAVPAAAGPAAARPAKPVSAPAGAAPHAIAVGKLSPRGCVQSAGSATCNLYAMAGTASVLGQPIPIWGFSTTGSPGSATAPGPVLAVTQGSAVTIVLHNQLSTNVSLALPGQAAAAFTGSYGDDTTGAPTGATRTYTFTASRPGTFVYEAGHTADGARQVAMGLAGALVVLPPDGSAYGTVSGMPNTTYDDDSVLVLSEIDPQLNAHPSTFDMRNFAPKYRLINGKPYPSTDPISTDQGHKVLVRYVNAGSQTHAMSVLGGLQVEIADDGHPAKYTTTVAAESIDPGQTLDTIVVMPTGPESKVTVYETAEHLDNNGQNTADPQQVAFGGMLTFLDTNAPPPSTDGVGPVSSHITAAPNPSDALSPVTITADLSDATTGGSNVTQAEYVVDDAVTTGVGFGTPMAATFGTVMVTGATGTLAVGDPATCAPATGPVPVTLSCLDAGKHTIFVRALDSAGNWGVVGSVIFNLPKTGPQTTNGSLTDSPANGVSDVEISATGDDSDAGGRITAAEYFVDTIGASGSGVTLTLNRSATVVSVDGVLTATDVHALIEGTHHIYVHTKDSLGLWGPPLDLPLVVDITGPGVDAASVGPNPSNALLSDKSYPGSLLISAQLTDRDSGGAVQSPLVAAEAFLNPRTATPAGGSGLQLIAVDGKINSSSEAVYGLIPLSQIKPLADGTHHVYVRGKDAAGNWGPLYGVNLIVDKTAPVLGVLTATPNPTNGAATLSASAPVTDASLISIAEYWFGPTDPGVGKANSVPVSVVAGQIVASVPLAGVTPGTQQLNLRVKDLAGNWSKTVSTSVSVSKPNAIFSSNFESGNLSDWGASTGTVSNSAAAKVVTSNEPASTRGAQVTVTTASRTGYLTDNTPTAETTYHARFAFNRNTLSTGTNTATALTLFEARSATGQVFALQFRMNGAQAQLRTVLNRTTGAALTGAWVNLASGAHTIQLDWLAAAAGSVVLKVDGATVQTSATGNTSSLRIESVRLGVTAGWATGTSGTAWFDTFASARNTL